MSAPARSCRPSVLLPFLRWHSRCFLVRQGGHDESNKILVPLDGSDMARRRSPGAGDGAGRLILILMRAANARILPGADVIGAEILAVREAEDYLAGVKENLEKAGVGGIETQSGTARRLRPSSRPPGPEVDVIVMTPTAQRARADHFRERRRISPAWHPGADPPGPALGRTRGAPAGQGEARPAEREALR